MILLYMPEVLFVRNDFFVRIPEVACRIPSEEWIYKGPKKKLVVTSSIKILTVESTDTIEQST